MASAPAKPKTYNGTAANLQDALDKAVASALRGAGGADRTISWTLKSLSGSAGGLKGGSKVKVSITSAPD